MYLHTATSDVLYAVYSCKFMTCHSLGGQSLCPVTRPVGSREGPHHVTSPALPVHLEHHHQIDLRPSLKLLHSLCNQSLHLPPKCPSSPVPPCKAPLLLTNVRNPVPRAQFFLLLTFPSQNGRHDGRLYVALRFDILILAPTHALPRAAVGLIIGFIFGNYNCASVASHSNALLT